MKPKLGRPPTREGLRKRPVSISLDEEDLRQLRWLAEAKNTSQAELVTTWIRRTYAAACKKRDGS